MMHKIIVITDSLDLSKSIARYIEYVLGEDYEVYYSDYEKTGSILSRELLQNSDLIVLEAVRTYENEPTIRIEGIETAKKLLDSEKKFLLIGTFPLEKPDPEIHFYWDVCSKRNLKESILLALNSPPASLEELKKLEKSFPDYLRFRPSHHHHHH